MKKQSFILSIFIFILSTAVSAQEVSDLPMHSCRRGTFPPDRVLRRAANSQDKGPGGNYFVGEKHQLVVLTEFADNPFLGDSAATIAKWDTILNAVQYNQPPFKGSFHDYFYDQSYGQFNLVCDLQYVVVDSCRRYRSTMTDDENSQYLIQDVVEILKQRDIQWALYDWNGDSYVNQVVIIYAGQGSAYGHMGPSYDAIWPHQYWLSWHLKDRQQGVYCDPDTVLYQGVDFIVDSYCAVPELTNDSTYGTFGTLCHEYTHCFGFPDFYFSGKVIGYWDLMDSGNYCGGGFRPIGYSAHERMLMGWLTPTVLTQPATVTDMPALVDAPQAYIIRNDAYPNEFFMLENRQKKGWDTELPGAGLTVFHIDYDPEMWITGLDNTRHYVLFAANNQISISGCSGWAYPYVLNDSIVNNALTDTSKPAAVLWHANTSGEKLMSKPVTDIALNDGLASFKFMTSPTELNDVPRDESQCTKIMRNGQLYLMYNGTMYNVQGQAVRRIP